MKLAILIFRVTLNSSLNILGFLGLLSIFSLTFLLPKLFGMDEQGNMLATGPNWSLITLYVVSVLCTFKMAIFGYFPVSELINSYWVLPKPAKDDETD